MSSKYIRRARTSETHPLLIDVVAVPCSRGSIGMTLCPGRRDVLSAAGPWQRDLDADFTVIADWQPELVVTLVETPEFALLGVPDFAKAARARFAAWRHLPIVDGGIPDSQWERSWQRVGGEARAALGSGGRILLHCRAGLGRTGLVAARLLIEMGATPQEAVDKVRENRPSRIENDRQLQYVFEQSRVIEDATS